MKIDWRCLTNYVGIGYGYSTHQKRLLEGLVRQGVEVTEESEIAVHLTTVDTFKPVPGKINVLYSMYECTDLPESWVPPLADADLIVVPCSHNKWLFRKYTDKPIEVCLEGVETDKYTYHERKFPADRPFTFLWVGATNPRKGTEYVMIAWELWCGYWARENPMVLDRTRLIMKTTQETDRVCGVAIDVRNTDGSGIFQATGQETMPAERICSIDWRTMKLSKVDDYYKAGNSIVDTRRLPVFPDGEPNYINPGSLVEMYHGAHAFLLPTRGEGFGLTLAEAAATGLPCIYTPWSGPVDFMNDKTGYPLKFSFGPVKTMAWNKKTGEKYISHETRAAVPDAKHIFRRMLQVYSDYGRALKKGKAASKHIQKFITWDISARRFMDIIEKHFSEKCGEVAA
jgi:glycosyltransferase involved in cell wall biosynthesis